MVKRRKRASLFRFSVPLLLTPQFSLYDALVFSRSHDGQFNWPICPPTLLRVQGPVPKAIRGAASVLGIRVEETVKDGRSGERLKRKAADRAHEEWEEWEAWEKELVGRVLDPVHFMRILDRGLEKAYGFAPLLAKQRLIPPSGLALGHAPRP